jgi:hypothetical protein
MAKKKNGKQEPTQEIGQVFADKAFIKQLVTKSPFKVSEPNGPEIGINEGFVIGFLTALSD